MNPPQFTLERLRRRLEARVIELDERIESGDADAWDDYYVAANAFAAIVAQLTPAAHGALLTTKELSAKLQCSERTIRRKTKAGALTPALRLGQRGRAALRWN